MIERLSGWRGIGALLVVVSVSPPICGEIEPDPAVAAMVERITAESLLMHVETLVAFGTRHSREPGGRDAQAHIETFLAGLELDEVYTHDFDDGSDNVIGVLRGERPDRLHVIGAHYDSVQGTDPAALAPGADDNASGVAALLEAARVLSTSDLRPAESILFVAFSGEEQGRLGSRAFVSYLADRPVTVVDMICLDSIGYLHPGSEPDLSVSSSSFTPEINELISRLGQVSGAYLPDWRYEGGPGCG